MDVRSAITQSGEYKSFRATVPKRRIDLEYKRKEYTFKIYDYGPKSVTSPIIFFPPVSGTADVFFRQIVSLTTEGFRCIAIDYPITWSVEEFVGVTLTLFRQFRFTKIHLVGASLGAFLVQKIAEQTKRERLVQSLTIINGFTDTSAFKSAPSALVVQMMPGFMLKRMLLLNLPEDPQHSAVADSIDFVVEQLETLTQRELASRLTLNIKPSYVDPGSIIEQNMKVMVVDVRDKCALSNEVRLEMLKYYPNARLAYFKHGGNFPYLAMASEMDMFLKEFYGTNISPSADEQLNARFREYNSSSNLSDGFASPKNQTEETVHISTSANNGHAKQVAGGEPSKTPSDDNKPALCSAKATTKQIYDDFGQPVLSKHKHIVDDDETF